MARSNFDLRENLSQLSLIKRLTAVAIEYAKQGASVVEVRVGNVRVLHGSAPALHAHGHVPHLIPTKTISVSFNQFSQSGKSSRYLNQAYLVAFSFVSLLGPIRN